MNRYLYFSPRGFSNEYDIIQVTPGEMGDVERWMNRLDFAKCRAAWANRRNYESEIRIGKVKNWSDYAKPYGSGNPGGPFVLTSRDLGLD